MEHDDPSFYLAPISESEAHDYFIATSTGPSFGNMEHWERPATPFPYEHDEGLADPEHIDAIFNNAPRLRNIAPRPRKLKNF